MTDKHENERSYGLVWDSYVKEAFPKIKARGGVRSEDLEVWRVLNTTDQSFAWPGDEWGDEKATAFLFSKAVEAHLQHAPDCFVEIGSGAGRYTVATLARYPQSRVLSFDVSIEFERALRERCARYIESGRLKTFLLDRNAGMMEQTIDQQGLREKIDVVYSFDAMMHVDLHTLVAYWINASRVLRQDGLLAMNVADATSENGFMKLLHNTRGVYALRGGVGPHFMWISPDIVRSILDRLGFKVTLCEGNGRDLSFAAILVDRHRGTDWLKKAGAVL